MDWDEIKKRIRDSFVPSELQGRKLPEAVVRSFMSDDQRAQLQAEEARKPYVVPKFSVAQVLDPVARQIPESLLEYLRDWLLWEIANSYPAIPPGMSDVGDAYSRRIKHIVSKLPLLKEGGAFKASVWHLGRYNEADLLFLLPRPTFADEKAEKAHEKERNRLSPEQIYAELPLMWQRVLSFEVPFDIDPAIRPEHSHVIGAQGSGKSQLLQYLVCKDIETDASVIVIEPKGKMTGQLARLASIPPERIVLVDSDTRLNIFDLPGDPTQVIPLLNYVFDSILEADITGKQAPLLNNCLQLLLRVPGATLIDLLDLLEQKDVPENYAKHVAALSRIPQEFFAKEFGRAGKDGFAETKIQVRRRIFQMLDNSAVERMFCAEKTSVNVSDVMEQGKVLLVDTAARHLGQGSAFLGRFFIALIALATERRDLHRNLRPCYVYIDEAADYLTDFLQKLFDKGREPKVCITIAHQHLSQLREISPRLESSVHNTSIKFVGRVNKDDAHSMAGHVFAEASVLQKQKPLHFHLYHRDLDQAVPITVPFLYLEKQPSRSDEEFKLFIKRQADHAVPASIKVRAETSQPKSPRRSRTEPTND